MNRFSGIDIKSKKCLNSTSLIGKLCAGILPVFPSLSELVPESTGLAPFVSNQGVRKVAIDHEI